MRLLLDSCKDIRALPALQAEGHDVDHVQLWESDPGDEAILRQAHAEERVLITLDQDFGRLIFGEGHPHCGLLRLVEFRTVDHAEALVAAIRHFGSELERRAIVVYEPDKSRVREGS